MKNSFKIVFFHSAVIHPYGRVILMPFKKCTLQFQVSAVFEFFNAIFHVGVCWFQNIYMSIHKKLHNNYLQLLSGKLQNFYFTEGSRDQFGLQNITSVARGIFQAKLVKGTRGEVKILISRKSCCTQFYRLLEKQVNDDKKSAIFK